MNSTMRRFIAVCSVALLAGCTSTMNEGQFNTVQAAVGGSPSIKRDIIRDCVKEERAIPASKQREFAALMNVSVANYPTSFCNRLWNAFASGRINYTDYRNLRNPNADRSKIVRIMQGR